MLSVVYKLNTLCAYVSIIEAIMKVSGACDLLLMLSFQALPGNG